MKVAMYLRVSTEEQREKQSIATQRTFANNYCATHSLSPYSWYEDDGVSGMLPLEQRPAGSRLIADSQDGKFDTIFVYKLDRFGREPRLILNAVSDLESLGIQIKSMTEPFDTGNPSGRFMLTILSAVAGLERDTIIQRSAEGSNRLAREGAWLGGIVPYGYQVVGKNRHARLTISEQVIAGLGVSEADIIRLIYHMSTEENKSCVVIANYLNAIGIPPAYVRDERELRRGKRKSVTAGVWRAGRIRSIIVNPTYKGLHQYGKRSKKQRDVIEREVPPIVSAELWDRAQVQLHDRILFSPRNARHSYLLRGIIKCGQCGLTYIGIGTHRSNGENKVYYKCNGRHQVYRYFGPSGKKCLSISVDGTMLETTVWQDIEKFLRHPGEVLDLVATHMNLRGDEAEQLRAEVAHLQQSVQIKNREKDTVITLFRRGRIDERSLDAQLDQIQQEEKDLQQQIAHLQGLLQNAHSVEATLRSTEELLQTLRHRLEEPLTWELKRQLIEALIERIVVNTIDTAQGKKEASITVIYRFGASLTF
jgi:site-specific DNA recombinase